MTLLYPFAPSDELDDDYLHMARDFFASRHPLSFDIARVAQWEGGGAVYGVPEPDGQLRATMRALWELFPEFPPYRGAAQDPPPHASLTLDGGDDPTRSWRASRSGCQACCRRISRSTKPC